MNRWLLDKLVDGAIEVCVESLVTLYAPYYSPYYSLMYYLAHHINYGIAVELGVGIGRGINALALGNPSLRVVGIDDTNRLSDGMIAHHDNITFIHCPSVPHPDRLGDIALLHIDTSHSYVQAKAEFESYKPMLLDEAVVLFDDTHAMEDGVKQFVDTLPYYKIYDDRLHPIHGYAVMLYETQMP